MDQQVKSTALQTKAEKYPNRWKKGQSGNPNGMVANPDMQILRDALEKAKASGNQHILEYAVKRAYENDTVLIAILKKLIPDKVEAGIIIKDYLLEKYRNRTPDQLKDEAMILANKIIAGRAKSPGN